MQYHSSCHRLSNAKGGTSLSSTALAMPRVEAPPLSNKALLAPLMAPMLVALDIRCALASVIARPMSNDESCRRLANGRSSWSNVALMLRIEASWRAPSAARIDCAATLGGVGGAAGKKAKIGSATRNEMAAVTYMYIDMSPGWLTSAGPRMNADAAPRLIERALMAVAVVLWYCERVGVRARARESECACTHE